jgi:hypothetical protein
MPEARDFATAAQSPFGGAETAREVTGVPTRHVGAPDSHEVRM